MQELAAERGHLFGYPLPDDRHKLVLAKRFPLQNMQGCSFADEGPRPNYADMNDEQIEFINSWETPTGTVVMFREDGKVKHVKIREYRELSAWEMKINTIGAAQNLSPFAEAKAMEKLQSMLSETMFTSYVMTGMFLETSKRSNVSYLFSRLRPTIAMSNWNGKTTPMVALCLHSIGYYARTFCGVMCPTDDVISHLTLMRGDEHMFWRQSTHHKLEWATSGV